MKNRVLIQDHESIPFHRGRPNSPNTNEESSKQKKVAKESKELTQVISESEKPGSIPFHKRETGLIL